VYFYSIASAKSHFAAVFLGHLMSAWYLSLVVEAVLQANFAYLWVISEYPTAVFFTYHVCSRLVSFHVYVKAEFVYILSARSLLHSWSLKALSFSFWIHRFYRCLKILSSGFDESPSYSTLDLVQAQNLSQTWPLSQ